MSQCLFCENSLEIYCKECQESYCHHCGILKHLRNGHMQPHIIDYLCEECEEEVSSVFCKSCEQNLCPACDIKIHNKGKRAQHTREPISNCFCMKDIKLVAHLTLDFLRDYCHVDDSEKFAEKLNEMSRNILKAHKGCDTSNLIFIAIIDQNNQEIIPEGNEKIIDALKKIRYKQFLLFEGGGQDEEDFIEFKQTVLKEKNFNDDPKSMQASIRDAYKIYQILKNINNAENLFIFDVFRNESLAKALKASESKEERKIFLNHDSNNPQPLEVTLYLFTKTSNFRKEEQIDLLQGVIPQLQIDTLNQKQKIISEPFRPPQLLEIQQLNSADRKESFGKEGRSWFNKESLKDPFKKSNQSFDEIILNTSSDQVLQKRNANFFKAQTPYSGGQAAFQRRSNILNDQPLKNIELNGSVKLSQFFQLELRKFAEKGDLLIQREDLIKKLSKITQVKFGSKIEDVFKQAEENKIIHTTIRKFLEIEPLFYVGMLLDVLSIESLIWIIRSIKSDSMTPTEKLILSRIKECYGLKVEQNAWKNIITHIMANQNSWQNKANSFEHASLFPLYAKKVLDPVTNTDTYVIYLTSEAWTPEDQGIVDDNSEEWRGFLQFINNFFKEDDPNTSIDQKVTSLPKQTTETDLDQSKKAIWSSSVENVLNRSTNKKEKSLKISEEIKAIPGGRYGCAQFIKICGPEVLKKLSIGRLTLFVQEAINKEILRYQRTLLVKNNPNDSIASNYTETEGPNSSFSQDPAMEKKTKLLKQIKDVLVEVLSESPDGIPLAQIPLHLKRKMDYVVNFPDLGFPKLKNFLATLPELVKIESSGTNHAVVKLKGNIPFNANKNLTLQEQIFLPDGQESTRNSYATQGNTNPILQHNLTNTNSTFDQVNYEHAKYKVLGDKKYHTTPSSDAKNIKGRPKKVSTLDDYLNKVKGLIDLILTDNCYGISMQKLHKELSNKLSFDFDCRLFNCNDFYEFLVTYAENLLDMEIKRNCLIIYPKNFRFGPQTLVNVVNTEQQRTSIKSGDNGGYFDHSVDNKRNFVNNPHFPLQNGPYIHSDRSNKTTSELDTPPGLAKPIAFKPNLSPFSTPFSNAGFINNPPQSKPNPKVDAGTTQTPNLSSISPVVFYGNEDDDAISEKQLLGHSRNVSYWKIDFMGNNLNAEETRGPITSVSQLNTGFHSRTDSKGVRMQVQEESNLDIKENLKFIEELLQDNEFNEKSIYTNFTLDKTHESSFGGFQSPNLSFNGLTTIGQANNTTLKQNHTKTQSEDFSNKNVLKFASGGHGRVASVVPERKNEE